MNLWLRVVLATLATWRVTHLLAYEDGPWHVLARLRQKLGSGFAGTLMDCFACLSFWVAAPLAFWVTDEPWGRFVTWLALSGAACLLERLGHEPVIFQPGTEPTESNHGMLRPTESDPSQSPRA